MRIAVTYEDGNIFQHFGHTETFKVYEVENGEIKSSQVIGSNGVGHGALAGLLSGEGIDVLICGGIGGGAQTALAEAGVELCSGAQGDADAAIITMVSIHAAITAMKDIVVTIAAITKVAAVITTTKAAIADTAAMERKGI